MRRAQASNLAVRVLTGVVGIPLVLLVNWRGGWIFGAFVGVAAAIAAWEASRLLRLDVARLPAALAVAASVAIAVAPAGLTDPQPMWIGVMVLLFGLAGAHQILPGPYERGDTRWPLVVVCALYAGVLLGLLHLLRQAPRGAWWVVLVLLVTWAYDTGAYFAGSTVGRRPFMRHVSSKKTLEGVAGGLLVSTLVGLVAIPSVHLLWWQGLLFGLLGGVVAQTGDLIESMLKRRAGVKDSGTIIPGHGGLLDRIDSLLWTGALGYYTALLLGHAP